MQPLLTVPRLLTPQAAHLANSAVSRLQELNRRTLDVIAARICFYYSFAYENLGRLAEVSNGGQVSGLGGRSTQLCAPQLWGVFL